MSQRFDRLAAKDAAARFHTRKAAQVLGRKGGQVTSPVKTAAAQKNGQRGGQVTSPAKARAARENGKLGGPSAGRSAPRSGERAARGPKSPG